MTDTPRTVAELKELFADNTSADISPQDLRDFVVSVADPVANGGVPHGPDDDNIAVYHFDAHNGIPADTWTILTASSSPTSYDPSGWLGDDDYDDDQLWSGGVLSAGQWVALPEGVYALQSTANMSAAITTGLIGLGMADARVSQDESLDPFVQFNAGGEAEAPAVWGVPGADGLRFGTHGFLRVKRALSPEHFAFVMQQNGGGSVDMGHAAILVMRITSTVPS